MAHPLACAEKDNCVDISLDLLGLCLEKGGFLVHSIPKETFGDSNPSSDALTWYIAEISLAFEVFDP